MRRKQDRRQPEADEPRRFPARRAPPPSGRLAPKPVDQAARAETGPLQRRHEAGWFEPDRPHPAPAGASSAAGGKPKPATPLQAPQRTPRAWRLIAPAVTLAVGIGLGFAAGEARSGGEQANALATALATRSPATPPAPAPYTSVVVRPAASSACLETARRGDQLIELLISNQRSRAADLLVAYTVANRQCHKDASP
jgi:hypothetical protein